MNKYAFLRRVFCAKSETTITREPNVRLSWTFFLCTSELNKLLSVPNQAIITNLRMRFFYFLVHLWVWVWPVRPNTKKTTKTNFPELELFWGSVVFKVGFITNSFQVKNFVNLIVELLKYIHDTIKLDWVH